MRIEAIAVDHREPEKLLSKLTETILERRIKTGLGLKLTLPHRRILDRGDIMIEFSDGVGKTMRIVIERKTISDALGNWNTSKKSAQSTGHAKNRYDIQAYDMLEWEKCDWGMMLVEDCDEPKNLLQQPVYQSHKAAFLQHLNTMADSALPVIRTRSMEETCLYITHLCERIINGEFQVFKRPLERIDMGDSIVTMFCSIADVGEELGRRIKAEFIDDTDPLEAFSKACRDHLNIVIDVSKGEKSKAAGQRESRLCGIKGIGWTNALTIADSICNWTKGV